MSKRAYFKRYLWLYDLIKNKPYITFNEIAERFVSSSLGDDIEVGFSKRTFLRDKQEIDDLFNIEIKYNPVRRGYYIENEKFSPNTELLIDSYRFINTYQVFKDVDRYIATEPYKSGSEHLLLILDATQNRKRIEFVYRKFVDDVPQKRTIEPFFIKEFKRRWYVIARDKKDLQIKTFALERIEKDIIAISPSASYDIPQNVSPASYFTDSFGIFRLSEAEVENIELSFSPLKGKFIKSQPLHPTQTILSDTDVELRIKLKLQITHDFIMEILSHGAEVKVISPSNLREKIVEQIKKTSKLYEN